MALKENSANKTLDLTTVDGTSDIKFPSAKATKDYVDSQIATGVVDATTLIKGKVQLNGDLTGTADLPRIAADAVTTDKILNANVTNDKIATGIDATKLADGSVTNTELQYIGTLSSDVQTQINGLNSNIATNASDITANTAAIATNTTDIATNASNITANTAAIATNTTDIATNTSDITVNTAAIATNTTDIANNASNITANTADIVTNTTDIAINASNITANTAAIATNTTDIATNALNITANTADIATNTTDIATNASNITANTAAIATNTTDIATNASDIAANTAAIATNTTDIATNASDITALKTLANGKIYVGNASNEATEVTPIGDVTITNSGTTAIGTGKVLTAMLANDAVETIKIKDANITTAKLASDAVTTVKITDANITYAKIQNVSATNKVLGRVSSGAGVIEEIATTGSGDVVRATSPTLATPDLGVPSAVDLTNATGLPLTSAVTGTLPVANGGTGLISLTAGYIPFGNDTGALSSSSNFTWDESNKLLMGVYIGRGADNHPTNTAYGLSNLASNNGGYYNVALGNNALSANTDASYNTGVGYSSLAANTIGASNTAIGYSSLSSNTSGGANNAFGFNALASNTIGSSNTAIGNNSLSFNTANGNTAIGVGTLVTNTSGTYNTAVGLNANVSSNDLTNATAIGSGALVDASNKIQLGDSSITLVNTAGKLMSGAVTYPNTDGTAGQILTTNGSGVASFVAIPSANLTSNVAGILPVANGGTGSATQNFVDLTAAQTIAGTKTFSSTIAGSITGNAATVTNGIYTTSKISDLSATTSSELAGKISNETGSGALVFAISPTLVTPTLGVATATSINGLTPTAQTTGFTIAGGTISKILTVSDDATISGTNTGDQTTITGNAGTVTTNANLTGPITSTGNATSIASQTGTGTKFVMDTSPTLVTPVIGAATGTSLSVSGQITSTVATGTAPLVVTSTTAVANLNIGGNAATVTTNANLTGDVISSGNATTVGKINGTALSGLVTGILKNTTTTGVPSIAVAADFPILNQNTSGNAATVTTNANLTGDVTSSGNATTVGKINGTALSGLVTGILKNTTTTGVPSIAVAADFPILNQNTSGNAATVTTNANLTGPITSTGNATSIASQTGTGTKFVMDTSPTLVTPVIGAATGTSLSVSGQLTSTVATGTAPLVVSSTTAVANLNIGGNAATATKLATARKINTVDFDGSGDITVTAAAGTLTGATLASNVLSSSLTSVGTIATGTWNGTTIAIANGGTGATSATAAFDALSPMTTKGDIIYGGDSGTGTRLAKGADGQVLTLASGIPSWSYSSGSVVVQNTTPYTIRLQDSYVFYTGSTNGTFTLPTVVAANAGKEITIKNKTANTITISGSAGIIYVDKDNTAATSVSIGNEASNNWIRLVYDGSQWNVLRALF